jgi:Myotubularin protein
MRQYIFTVLQEQPIFHSLRFWNAAFFEALQGERSLRPVATRQDVLNNQMEAITDEKAYQENITFGQLGYVKISKPSH